MTFDKKELISAEKAILGKCGIYCGACDSYLGGAKAYAKEIIENLGINEQKIKTAAERLLTIMNQVNYFDVIGFFDLGINVKQYKEFERFLEVIAEGTLAIDEKIDVKSFQRVLRKFVEISNCSGCGTGAGAARMCPIVICCENKGYITCAECPDIKNHNICMTVDEMHLPSMITDNVTFFKLITHRYMNWNVENLKKIIKKGYKQYLNEMKEKVQKGFSSGQVICKDPVFRELLGF